MKNEKYIKNEKCRCCGEDIEKSIRIWFGKQIPKNINLECIYEWTEANITRLMDGLSREEAEYIFLLIIRDKLEGK